MTFISKVLLVVSLIILTVSGTALFPAHASEIEIKIPPFCVLCTCSTSNRTCRSWAGIDFITNYWCGCACDPILDTVCY